MPSVFENQVPTVEVDRISVELPLWDAAGSEKYDRLRTLYYPDSNGILICFAAENPDSLNNVEGKTVCPYHLTSSSLPNFQMATQRPKPSLGS